MNKLVLALVFVSLAPRMAFSDENAPPPANIPPPGYAPVRMASNGFALTF